MREIDEIITILETMFNITALEWEKDSWELKVYEYAGEKVFNFTRAIPDPTEEEMAAARDLFGDD